jgi:hypothetical protein
MVEWRGKRVVEKRGRGEEGKTSVDSRCVSQTKGGKCVEL